MYANNSGWGYRTLYIGKGSKGSEQNPEIGYKKSRNHDNLEEYVFNVFKRNQIKFILQKPCAILFIHFVFLYFISLQCQNSKDQCIGDNPEVPDTYIVTLLR